MSKNVKKEYKNSKDEQVVIYIRKPNAKDWRQAKIYSTAIAAEMMRHKTPTGEAAFIMRSQVKDHLIASGIWTPKQQEELTKLNKQASELEAKLLGGGMSKKEGKELAIKIIDIKDKQILLLLKLNEFDNLTVEYHTENAELDFLSSACLVKEDGEQLFENVDDCVERLNDEPYYLTAREDLRKIIFGDIKYEDTLKERNEYKYLLHFKFINEKFELINEEGQPVDRDGKLFENDDAKEAPNELDFSKFTDE